ncbi:unnamed protein product [Rhizophagus irregularis]|nr:unnamed protein product [Rhizophagus irregularis]
MVRKLKVELKISEISKGEVKNKEEIIEEIDVYEEDWVEYYEEMKNNKDMMRKLDMVYGMIDVYRSFKERHGNTVLCHGCVMPINVEKEKEELLLIGKEFRSYCIDCEKEELDITDSELNYKNDDNDMEIVNEILQEESSGDESETNIEGENSNKRKRRTEKEINNIEKGDKRKKIRIEDEESTEEEEILENETKAFEKLLKDLSTPVIEEQLKEEENIEDMTLEGLFIRAEKGSQELVKYWFDVGEEFRNEIRKMRGKTSKKEKTIRSDIYNRMEKNLKGRTKKAIQSRLTRAECVYRLFKGIGGKQKINRMRNTCMDTIIGLKIKEGEVDELIRKVNEIEEERNSIMEE